MEISSIILMIMAIFMAWAAIDKVILNNRFGYGEKFDEGMNAMGPLATAMVGFMCLAPVLGNILTPIVTPFFKLFGGDPAMLAGSLLALDMGGYPLAKAMTSEGQIAAFSGGLYASMMGATITFGIPVALGILKQEDRPYMAKGIMAGVITIPFACFIGGLIAGISAPKLIANLVPAFLLAILLTLGLWKIPNGLMKGFHVFSKFITIVVYLALACAIFDELTGIVMISGMDPIGPQLEIVGLIAITLAGAYPFVYFITKTFSKVIKKLGGLIGVNENAIAGIIASLANSLPMLDMVKDMDKRGKVVAIAFSVPAAFVFGDHLAYASANLPTYIFPLIATKLIGGILAIAIALLITREKT